MLDSHTYRINEQLAKSLIPSWRVSQIHNVDHFERSGFPVRLASVRELGQIIDTMQENRFDRYMRELGGLSDQDYASVLSACRDAIRFQLSYLPHRPPVLPVSTILSAFAIYKKLRGAVPDFGSVLEIGPGCGYVSFFMKQHGPLENYSQIEACESFYILQNLVNLYCFGPASEERALTPEGFPSVDYFVNPSGDMEFSPTVRLKRKSPVCTHYPWWRIGEILTRDIKFDLVTSNANLLEFNAAALNDYLSLLHHCLKPEGYFLVQCTGFTASGSVDSLLDKIYEKGFAPLMFMREGQATKFPGSGKSSVAGLLEGGSAASVAFTTNNALFVKKGHLLFDTYYQRKNYHLQFISPEPVVASTFFSQPGPRTSYPMQKFVDDVETSLAGI